MFIEPTITWVPSGLSGYIWLDTKIVFKKKERGEKKKVRNTFIPVLQLHSHTKPQNQTLKSNI